MMRLEEANRTGRGWRKACGALLAYPVYVTLRQALMPPLMKGNYKMGLENLCTTEFTFVKISALPSITIRLLLQPEASIIA